VGTDAKLFRECDEINVTCDRQHRKCGSGDTPVGYFFLLTGKKHDTEQR